MALGLKECKTLKAGDFITEQFISKKAGVIIDGPWAASSFKDAGVNFGVMEIPTLTNGKNTNRSQVVKLGLFQTILKEKRLLKNSLIM